MILMEVIIMNMSHTVCQIEHHAMMFAFLSKHAIRLCGNRGKDAILDAMTKYGKERGRRMALNAQTHGDPLNTSGSLTTMDRWNLASSVRSRHCRPTFPNAPGVKPGRSTTLPNTANTTVSMLTMLSIRDSDRILHVHRSALL